MVRVSTNHILRCKSCLLSITDEGEIIWMDEGCILVNDAKNVTIQPVVKVATGMEIRPVVCNSCEQPLGFRFEQNLICLAHQHKIALHREYLTTFDVLDLFIPTG